MISLSKLAGNPSLTQNRVLQTHHYWHGLPRYLRFVHLEKAEVWSAWHLLTSCPVYIFSEARKGSVSRYMRSIHVYSEANKSFYLYPSCSFTKKFAFWGLSMGGPRRAYIVN